MSGHDRRPRVFVSRVIAEPALAMLRAMADVEVWPEELPPPRQVLEEKVRDIDGLLCLLTDTVDGPLLDLAPRLKIVANHAVGFDNIDVPAATARGVLVSNTPGVLTETTADFAFALILAAGRRVVEGDAFTRAGRWKTWGPMLLLGQDVHGATLGLVGLGRIGAAVARRAAGFNMRVLYTDPNRRPDLEASLGVEFREFKDLLAEADFISIHVPLAAETTHLFNAEAFRRMKRTAVLVNTARGPIIDEVALYEALVTGQIAAAGLDVTEQEPIPPSSPLLGLPNVILCPHIASASVATRTRMGTMAAENIVAALGERVPPNLINPEALRPRGA